ncbi:MAG: tRNA preQ1(34) S-adenosylmethionine ribosyltransferase-isomerase QueA [Verrucomicrobiaceae bacterium]|nr:MAG: tRNA preQ1(34) S-adenosylmethionine ribosyltransferase-isomerase QueA [Verrucomicrobiaceae bacterium]
MLRTDDFDYHLPEELIASRPPERRDGARMLVIDRASGTLEHRRFADFPELLNAQSDLVVLNDVRVARARFFSDDGRFELLRLRALTPTLWHCMAKPGKRLAPGKQVTVGGITGTVREVMPDGTRTVEFEAVIDENAHGHLPLPHYMRRDDDSGDDERYQTVFASPDKTMAIAAPTAGLHFTPDLLSRIPHAFLTLEVGAGTFQPVKAELLRDHVMHTERYAITPEAAAAIESAPRRVAIGTTVTRVLEHCARTHGGVTPHAGETSIFLHPPCAFLRTDALLTNFHLPKSTLFMLVCAFGGTALMREAYAEAIARRYRFYSYGDCMFIR